MSGQAPPAISHEQHRERMRELQARRSERMRARSALVGNKGATSSVPRERMAELLEECPAAIGRMSIYDLIIRAYFYGPDTTHRLLRSEGIGEYRRVEELSPRQRQRLALRMRGRT